MSDIYYFVDPPNHKNNKIQIIAFTHIWLSILKKIITDIAKYLKPLSYHPTLNAYLINHD